jgi:outer membrane protein assembly factor BamA
MKRTTMIGLGALLFSAGPSGCSTDTADASAQPQPRPTDSYTLSSVEIRDEAGTPVPDEARAIVDDNLRVGDPAIYDHLSATLHDLKAYYVDAGYPHVNVIPITSQDDDAQTLTIEFVIQRQDAAG